MSAGLLTPEEHLGSATKLIHLLIARHITRVWPRLLSAAGTLSDLFVSLPEVRMALFPDRFPSDATEAGLPGAEAVERALGAASATLADRVSHSEIDLPIENLRALFGLQPIELTVILALYAIQTDANTQRIATYAWADFSVKQPTLGFLAELVSSNHEELRQVLDLASPVHPLRQLRVIDLSRSDRWRDDTPDAGLGVRLPERIASFLRGEPGPLVVDGLGGSAPDGLDGYCSVFGPVDPRLTTLTPELLSRTLAALRHAHRGLRRQGGPALALSAAVPTIVFSGPSPEDARDLARMASGERPTLVIDLALAHSQAALTEPRAEQVLAVALREVMLLGAQPLVVLGELQKEGAFHHALTALRRLIRAARSALFISVPDLSRALSALLGPTAEIAIPAGAPPVRLAVWRRALELDDEAGGDLPRVVDDLAHRYALSGQAIRDAAATARFHAALRRSVDPRALGDVLPSDLLSAIRGQVHHRLGTIAEPFSTQLSWTDFAAPRELMERLREVVSWARHHRQVHEDWGFGRLAGYGRGLTVLLAGPPGTGKTFAAALIAKDLGAELYRVDLSRTVDKFIGETEKNLAKLFDEAERSGAIVLFDEADSLFAKRTQVTSSNDRYANLEVNFLLQRMEHFEGTTILTTNFAENLDEAFKRRIKFRLTFRLPTPEEREAVWRGMIPPEAPQNAKIDFVRLAKNFEFAPAYIKNCVMRAAFRAAQQQRPIDDELLFAAARAEYQELGRVVRED